jgi:hypothetical protein
MGTVRPPYVFFPFSTPSTLFPCTPSTVTLTFSHSLQHLVLKSSLAGKTDFEEFCTMLRDARESANLFTGAEDAEALSDKQLTTLLTFDKWPTKKNGCTFSSSHA